MSAIILPHRRTRQPRWPVGLDKSSSLTRGLKSVLIPGLGYDPVVGPADYVNSGGVYASTVKGKSLGFNVTTRGIDSLDCNLHNLVTLAEGTLLAWWIPTDVTDATQHIAGISSANNRFYLRNNSGAFQYGWASTVNRSTTAVWTLNKPSVASISWREISCWAYFDGIVVGSVAASVMSESPDKSMVAQSPRYPTTTTTSGRGYALMVAAWNRLVLPAEQLAIAQNPWRLLAPTESKLWAVPMGTVGDDKTQAGIFTASSALGAAGKKNAKVSTTFTSLAAIQADGVKAGGAVTVATAQPGNWSSTSTWVGGVIPGSGTLALINHNVVLDSGRTVGDGTDAVLIGNGAKLTINATLTCNGNLTVGLPLGGSGTSWVGNLEFGPGSELALEGHDLILNVCRLLSTATSANWAVITGTGSRIVTGSAYTNPRQDFNLDYVSFQATGSCVFAAANSPTTAGVTSRLRFNHCVFASSGALTFGTGGYTPATTQIDVCYSDFRDNNSILFIGISSDEQAPLFEYNTVYSPLVKTDYFFNCFLRNMSYKGTVYIADCLRYGYGEGLDGAFFAHPIGIKDAPNFAYPLSTSETSPVRNLFCYADDTIGNSHGIIHPKSGTIEDCFFEIYGLEPNVLFSVNNSTVKGNILKGRGVLVSITSDLVATGPIDVLNNTVHLQVRAPESYHQGVWLTENANAGYIGTVNVRNNLCGFETERDIPVYRSNRGELSTATLTNVEGNAYYNNLKTGTAKFMAIAVTNLNDLGDDIAPAYLDSGRGLRPWVDMMLGQARGTATEQDAFDFMLSANGYNPTTKCQDLNLVPTGFAITGSANALLDWCRAGFSPTNTALRGTGYDGLDIGAMPVSSGGTSTSGATFTAANTIGSAGKKAARGGAGFNITASLGISGIKRALSFAYGEGAAWDESAPWDESEPWDESAGWGDVSFLIHTTAVGMGGEKNAFAPASAAYASDFAAAGIKSALGPAPFAHLSRFIAFSSKDTMYRFVVATFETEHVLGLSGVKNAFDGVGFSHAIELEAGGIAIMRIAYGPTFFEHAHTLGVGGRKIFSYAQIQEADVATINQGGRVPVKFVQGESVERNTFFFMPDGTTPISDLSMYSARMELREYPDDPEPILTMTSQDAEIFLSDTGLIVWEIPGSVTKDFTVPTFGGDLFVYAPDGDAIMVCGFDFEMTMSHTRGV